ncbi:MAG TPA: hypothetical protein VN420_04730 [Candidatus Fimivivens sp.]|nr:hypothetical protein [Candidatus Fimivivens sp.]
MRDNAIGSIIFAAIISFIAWLSCVGFDLVFHFGIGRPNYWLMFIVVFLLDTVSEIRKLYAFATSKRYMYFKKGASGRYEIVRKNGIVTDVYLYRAKRLTTFRAGTRITIPSNNTKCVLEFTTPFAVMLTEDYVETLSSEVPFVQPNRLTCTISVKVLHDCMFTGTPITLTPNMVEIVGTDYRLPIVNLKTGNPEVTLRFVKMESLPGCGK